MPRPKVHQIIYADLDELVFENRSQSYGAYVLRKQYQQQLAKSLAISLYIFLTAIAIIKAHNSLTQTPIPGPDYNHHELVFVMDPNLPDVSENEEEEINSVDFDVPKPQKEELLVCNATITDIPAIEASNPGFKLEEASGFSYDFSDIKAIEQEEEVDSFPDFDQESWNVDTCDLHYPTISMTNLNQLIHYPEKAKKAGITGVVIVRVMINQKGNYVKHLVLKDPHPLLTNAVEEQIDRLIVSPRIFNGKPIKTWVAIPFRFKMQR